ncbi:MAG: F0F1 ATP synthase subunit delta [Nocardioides sp.]
MLRGASAEALAGLSDGLGRSGTLADAATTGEELFGVARILRSDAALRRVVTDSSVEGDAKAGVATTVFGKAVGEAALKVLTDAVSRRWTMSADLPAAIEQLAVLSTVRSAGKDGARVGDELFAVRRLIDTHPELRSALSDQSRSAADRTGLLHGLLDGKTLPATTLLVGEAISGGHGTVDSTLEDYLVLAAAALDEAVATVHAARELTPQEQDRLVAALSKQYGTQVQLHVVVDPDLVGGMRVQIRDDVIDGTVAGRLDDAGRKLAG